MSQEETFSSYHPPECLPALVSVLITAHVRVTEMVPELGQLQILHTHHYHHYHHHHHHHHLCGDAHVVVEGELVAVEHGRPGEPVRLHPTLAPRPHCLNTD